MTLVLASKSVSRKAMLENAGVIIECLPANVDEAMVKDSLIGEGVTPRNLVDALAEAKSLRVSRRIPGAMVLGADSILVTEKGEYLDKPETPDDAKAHLKMLSGATHSLMSGAVISEDGEPVWRHIDVAKMTMRTLSDAFIDDYVAENWDNIRHCVGCYEIEGRGAQLFTRVLGSQFTIMGLPLLHLLDYLRIRKVLPS